MSAQSTQPPDILRIAVAQANPTVGDLAGNLTLARRCVADAARQGADLVVFSELFLCGYPPEDLVLKRRFVSACRETLTPLAADTVDGPGVLMGLPWADGDKLHNSVALLDRGEMRTVRHKVDLPNYGVFDEKRVFDAGPMTGPMSFRGVRLGVVICEDIWGGAGVCEMLAESGAEILVVPNGSPYSRTKREVREQVVMRQVIESGLPMLYTNQLGGQDELVFDGGSFAMNADRTVPFQMDQFESNVALTTWRRGSGGWSCDVGARARPPERLEADWRACVLGTRDYVEKNGFSNVVLGLSGGIDSAVVAAMAVDALGEERVRCIMMPYRYTSAESITDAEACARALGVRYETVPIEHPVSGFSEALREAFHGTPDGVTEENLQSRTRGTILMAISNKFGAMVLTTGNKSEMSVGYATLYGDMNGGFNPIKDIYKTEVVALARWRNANVPSDARGPSGVVIPTNIIDKPPSAELRPDQKDEDSLPPYPVLDEVLNGLVEEESSIREIVDRGRGRGIDEALVERIEHLLYVAEYKRRQAAPGVKITSRAFGRERRYPITNRWRDRSPD